MRRRIGNELTRVWSKERPKNGKSSKLRRWPTKLSRNRERFLPEGRGLLSKRGWSLNGSVNLGNRKSNNRAKKNKKRWNRYFKTPRTSSSWRRKRCFQQWPKQIEDKKSSRKNRRDKSRLRSSKMSSAKSIRKGWETSCMRNVKKRWIPSSALDSKKKFNSSRSTKEESMKLLSKKRSKWSREKTGCKMSIGLPERINISKKRFCRKLNLINRGVMISNARKPKCLTPDSR